MAEPSPPGFDPAAVAAQARSLAEREMAEQIEFRRKVVYWAAVLCSCRSSFGDGPAQAGCAVHGTHLITARGEVL